MESGEGIVLNTTSTGRARDRISDRKIFGLQIDEMSYLLQVIDYSMLWRMGQVDRIKRILDIVLAILALIILAPVLFIAALLISIESRGPIFFRQERIGINRRRGERRSAWKEIKSDMRRGGDRRKNIHAGKPFNIFKLRTMRADAEEFGPALAYKNDPRITRIGRLMRKTRIDEIPQFINVIKGDMSIVGPRPERSFFINKFKQEIPEFTMRLIVKPGITGLAQVESGYAQTVDKVREKLLYDLRYISRLSVLMDLEILFKTIRVVLTGKGAC